MPRDDAAYRAAYREVYGEPDAPPATLPPPSSSYEKAFPIPKPPAVRHLRYLRRAGRTEGPELDQLRATLARLLARGPLVITIDSEGQAHFCSARIAETRQEAA